VQLEGLGQLKNPVTSGIEAATFELVAEYLSQRSSSTYLNINTVFKITIIFDYAESAIFAIL
jgi:hypothetical protein